MIKINSRFVAAFALLLSLVSLGSVPAHAAQTTITSTTNTAAISLSQGSFVVGSATDILAPSFAQAKGGTGSSTAPNLTVLYVDREAMDVISVSSTTVTVKRGTRGTSPSAHIAGRKVWVAASGLYTTVDPSGACAPPAYIPVINIANGKMWNCSASTGGQWGNFTDTPQVGAVLASQGGAMTGAYAVVAKIHHVSGTAAITGWAIPPGLRDGDSFITIPDGAFTWTEAGNIISTGTAVVGRAIIWTYDRAAAKLYPNQ